MSAAKAATIAAVIELLPATELPQHHGGAVTPLPEQQFHSDPIALFRMRAEQHAARYARGEISKPDAVDQTHADAIASGLVAAIGQDAVQEIMSAAFDDGRVALWRTAQ
jgi:hypothetical protein